MSDPFPRHEDIDAPPEFFIAPPDSDPASEYARQRAIVAAASSRGLFVRAIPQAGKASDWQRLQRWREGARAGFPDLFLAWRTGVYLAEIKDGRGRPDKRQTATLNVIHSLGIPCGVHRSWATLAGELRKAGWNG